MKYDMTTPCDACPFLKKMAYGPKNRGGFQEDRLEEFASTEFHCHKTGQVDEGDPDSSGDFIPTPDSQHCAGALIYLEKRERPHQMMRICERLGKYDRRKLNMKAKVR